MADGFLSRWSQRKQDIRQGRTVVDEPAKPIPPALSDKAPAADAKKPVTDVAALASTDTGAAQDAADAPEAKLPTLDDVAQLTPESDFSSFVAQGVPPDVRNAAVKKLFADPRYSLIDGLDIYLEDYSLPSPLSAAMLAKMHSAKVLKLVDDPDEQKSAPLAQPPQGLQQGEDLSASAQTEETGSTSDEAAAEAQNPTLTTTPEPSAQPTGETHDDPDLRLQPNHAAVGADAERGT